MRALVVAVRRPWRLGSLLVCVLGAVMAVGVAPALAISPPTVSIGSPSSVAYTTAHLGGSVNPEGSETTYQFQYSTEPEFLGWTAAGEPRSAGSGSSAVEVEEDLTGLAPNTTYLVRLVAVNAEGTQEAATEAPYPTFTTLEVAAPTVSIAAPSALTGTSAVFSGEINPGAPAGNPAAFDVEWHFACAPECPGLTGGTVPADAEGHTVEAATTGLLPGVHYEVSLIASNAGGQAAAGPEGFTTQVIVPQLVETSAHVQITEATLQAQVNPSGAETTYHFEYGPTAAYGHSTPATTIPAGNTAVKASAVVMGLSPATAYHYRVVISNSAGTVEGPDKTLTTVSTGPVADNCPNAAIRAQQDTSNLPECRAMELVNPPGNDLGDVVRVLRSSNDGEHVAYASPVLPNGSLGGQLAYIAVGNRGSTGWSSADANLPISDGEEGANSVGWSGFSEDLSKLVLYTGFSPDPADTDLTDLYRLQVGTGASTWVSNVRGGGNFFYYVGGSTDLSRVVFFDASGGGGAGKLYAMSQGLPEPVGVDTSGNEMPNLEAVEHVTYWALRTHTRHPVSNDGTKIFFYSSGALYRRDTTTQTTIPVSASQRTGNIGATGPAFFIGATADGGVVYFQSSEQLTDTAPEGGGIYRYDVEAKDLTLIATDPNDTALGSGQQLADISVILLTRSLLSEDGSHLYFTSPNALAPGAQAGEPNLYVWSAGKGTRLVAAGVDGLVRVSTNGRYAVITTTTSIGGAPNNHHEAIYEYDDETGVVSCASCRPDGSPSEGDAVTELAPFNSVSSRIQKSRTIADNGAVFFNSFDRLVPADHTDASDVYEYRAGAVSLLSSGAGDSNSWLGDSSDNGRDVFIMTRTAYDPRDQDANEVDLYDARIDGGFPYQKEAVAAKCSGDACQAPPTAAPGPPSLGSAGLHGQGNLKSLSVKVAKPKAARGASITLSIQLPGAGGLTVSGAHLKNVARGVDRAGVYRVRITLTSATRAALKRKRSVTAVAKLLFTASDGSKASATVKLLFKSASSKGSR